MSNEERQEKLKLERQKLAEASGIIENIGRKIKAKKTFIFRSDDVAEIVGWHLKMSRPQKPGNRMTAYYCIKYENGECRLIPEKSLINYIFID